MLALRAGQVRLTFRTKTEDGDEAWQAVVEAVLSHAAATPDLLAQQLEQRPDHAPAHALKGLMWTPPMARLF
jgi:hypothetical protein